MSPDGHFESVDSNVCLCMLPKNWVIIVGSRTCTRACSNPGSFHHMPPFTTCTNRFYSSDFPIRTRQLSYSFPTPKRKDSWTQNQIQDLEAFFEVLLKRKPLTWKPNLAALISAFDSIENPRNITWNPNLFKALDVLLKPHVFRQPFIHQPPAMHHVA